MSSVGSVLTRRYLCVRTAAGICEMDLALKGMDSMSRLSAMTHHMVKLDVPRREVIDHAKRLVLTYGPDNILDHPQECVLATHRYDEGFPVEEVAEEAIRQAERVYAFLGYHHA